ncbi:MAG: FlgD immunoglobulin-like domain containing protein [Candidatus Eisenbacteria bacterium]
MRRARIMAVALGLATLCLGGALLAGPVSDPRGPAVPGGPTIGIPDDREARDPLKPMVRRLDRYFRTHRADGVTMDSRYDINPSEAIRMGVVCQLLGYCEYLNVHPTRRVRDDIAAHADYLVAHLADITSGTPFDGMLGYSLVRAYEVTANGAHLAAAQRIVAELEAIPTSECILNGGLMVALDMAEYARLTGDATAAQKAHDILTQLPPYQNPDGSFPHWCAGSEDIHYTGWMAMELDLIGRVMPDPNIEPVLTRMHDWIEQRVDATGHSHYEEACPDCPDGLRYYDSRRSGCSIDYDTRGWTVEPAYNALLLDRYRSRKYLPVMDFLGTLETDGTFADKWDFIPPPDDPEYPWSIADTSVANMSIIFWALTSLESRRGGRDGGVLADVADDGGIGPGPATPVRLPTPPRSSWRWSEVDRRLIAGALSGAEVRIGASGRDADPIRRGPGSAPTTPAVTLESIGPARGTTSLRYALPAPGVVDLTLYDDAGRHIRELAHGERPAGEHVVAWDGRDQGGHPVPSGVYFARLVAGDRRRATAIVLMR